MSDLYLIAHIVRGFPAFDIASQIEIEDEIIWIIPTSGHRAWPYWSTSLENCIVHYNNNMLSMYDMEKCLAPPIGHPDHYSAPAARGAGKITNLASLLGIRKPEEVKRRV